MKDSIIFTRSNDFSIAIIRYVEELNNKRQFVLGIQVLKSGTSIGANIAEALDAQSRKDFLSKMSIALKEARETKYWLFLLQKTELLDETNSYLLVEIEQIYAMLNKIVKTTRST